MNHELLSVILGSTAGGAALTTAINKAYDWVSGRARKKRDLEKETARALAVERARSFDCEQALYEALRELSKLKADKRLIERLKRVAAGQTHSEDHKDN